MGPHALYSKNLISIVHRALPRARLNEPSPLLTIFWKSQGVLSAHHPHSVWKSHTEASQNRIFISPDLCLASLSTVLLDTILVSGLMIIVTTCILLTSCWPKYYLKFWVSTFFSRFASWIISQRVRDYAFSFLSPCFCVERRWRRAHCSFFALLVTRWSLIVAGGEVMTPWMNLAFWWLEMRNYFALRFCDWISHRHTDCFMTDLTIAALGFFSVFR